MDNQRNSLLNWAYYCQGKSMEELWHLVLCTNLELDQMKLAAQDELRKRDDQLIHMKDLLSRMIRERDEAVDKCQRLQLEKLLLQQQKNAPLSGISSIEDEPRRGIDSNNGFSSSDCDESIVSSPIIDPILPQLTPPLPPPPQTALPEKPLPEMVVPEKPLPEKGKLLQAVMKAGPLLQTLLLAGPLPQWRHPPPPLESFEIPPVTIPSPPPQPPQLLLHDSIINTNGCNRKRVLGFDGCDSPTETKHQRMLLNH